MNLRRIASAQVLLFLYITSDGLIDLVLRLLLWGAVLLIVFREKALPVINELAPKLTQIQQKVITKFNKYLSDFSIGRVIKTLVVLKVLLFFTWLIPQCLIVFALVQAWAFKEQIRPYRQQLKEKVRNTSQLIQDKVSELISQVPRYNRSHL